MKKIIFIVENLSGRGGMENVSRQVITQLNNDVNFTAGLYIIGSGEFHSSIEWKNGIVLGESKQLTRNPKIARFLHVMQFLTFLRKYRPSIVIAMNTIPCYIAKKAIKLSGQKISLSTWMHLPPKERYRPHYLNYADHHFAISRGVASQLESLTCDPNNIDVIFNPIKKSSLTIQRSEKFKLLYVGRIHFEGQKRLKDLFDACKRLNFDWQLDIVGDGEDTDACKEYLINNDISNNVVWHGWQNNSWDYIQDKIKAVSCLVLTSSMEGLPLVILEAMARGVYCVSSDCVSGPGDIIQDGFNGKLYETFNIDKLTLALHRVYQEENLPSHEEIKESISMFYEDSYMKTLKEILNRLTEGK